MGALRGGPVFRDAKYEQPTGALSAWVISNPEISTLRGRIKGGYDFQIREIRSFRRRIAGWRDFQAAK